MKATFLVWAFSRRSHAYLRSDPRDIAHCYPAHKNAAGHAFLNPTPDRSYVALCGFRNTHHPRYHSLPFRVPTTSHTCETCSRIVLGAASFLGERS
jgi:hypothetical protein